MMAKMLGLEVASNATVELKFRAQCCQFALRGFGCCTDNCKRKARRLPDYGSGGSRVRWFPAPLRNRIAGGVLREAGHGVPHWCNPSLDLPCPATGLLGWLARRELKTLNIRSPARRCPAVPLSSSSRCQHCHCLLVVNRTS